MRLRQSASALSRWSAEVLAGRYRLDAVIGSGGAGDVHRGFDLRLKRPVAVKIFRAGADLDMEERFHNEAVILARLQHPGLVTVYDAGRHRGHAYMVMQLIEGLTLKERIAAGPLAPGETAALGADLARALSHAHEEGIVHRDVKPSNIILDASGHPHLTDFGISLLLDATTRTATGELIGTAAYLSPEQVLGQSVGPPADVYALGLVLLECVTGRLEYDGGPLEAAIARLHRRPELPGFLPEDLAALLRDMTALEARDRPPAHDCARTLTALSGTTDPESVPSPADVTSMVPRQAPARADVTHPRPSHPAGVSTTKDAPARGRVLVAGGAAALAAVMAAALAVSDGSSYQGSGDKATRAASGPSAEAVSPGTSAPRNGAGPAAPTPSPRDASAEQLRAPDPDDPGLGQGSGSASAAPSREPVAGTGTQGTTAAPSPSTAAGTPDSRVTEVSDKATRAETGAQTPSEQPGKSSKAAKPREKARTSKD
ncbi:protein kinase [Streptomyces sp. NPDC051315]|uniref:serine/threonine-protein kinase n=1 Tax=Streptomyces sp. NPDC051315 TaxID=3365650 RepID=UPI0037ADA4FB